MLIQLIYASRAKDALVSSDIRQILDVSQANNRRDGLSGMLCHGNGHFLQYLEGKRENVNAAYARIMRDPRHDALVLLHYGLIDMPQFADWEMGYVSGEDPETRTILCETANNNVFYPEALNAGEAVALIAALKSRVTPQIGFE